MDSSAFSIADLRIQAAEDAQNVRIRVFDQRYGLADIGDR
jgi:hypothetical protein